MATGFLNLFRGEFYEKGTAPRQRRVFLMRWNPSISGFTREDFENYFQYFKGNTESVEDSNINWTIWDWKEVMHRDLFVMMQVGQEKNGIVWGGFLNGPPYQYMDEKGKKTKTRFIETAVMYMHRIENTGILSSERLADQIPEVDWLHGHAGELLSVEVAEKLGILMVDELRKVDDNKDVYFDDYNQKKYVLQDILTFMCPELKKRLLSMGRCENNGINDINELAVKIDDEEYQKWNKLEDHLSLEELNGILI